MNRAAAKHAARLRALCRRLGAPDGAVVKRWQGEWIMVWDGGHVHLCDLDPPHVTEREGGGWARSAETVEEVVAEACRALGVRPSQGGTGR